MHSEAVGRWRGREEGRDRQPGEEAATAGGAGVEGASLPLVDQPASQGFFSGDETFLKFLFGKLITISFWRPIRTKPVSCRHKFEFQSLLLTQLINEFLNAD